MIKYWQSMHDYRYFLNESKVHFDSSERSRLHSELWDAWQKLQIFNIDAAIQFLLPFYKSPCERCYETEIVIMRATRKSVEGQYQLVLDN